MSFLEFPQWRTRRNRQGRRRRRVVETRTALTSEIMTLDMRELLGGMPIVSIGDVTVPAEGPPIFFTNASFLVMLSETSSSDVIVSFATQDGTANSSGNIGNGFQSDYSARTGSVTIPAGQTIGSVTVPVAGDNLIETNETFLVVLTNPSGATFPGNVGSLTATGTITDDENPADPALSVSNPTIVEGNRGTKNMQFIVSVFPTPTSQNNITYFFFTSEGTATDPEDFQSRDNLRTMPAGQVMDTLNVPIVGDRTTEPNDTFYLVTEAVTNANVLKPIGTATILNDDGGTGVARTTVNMQTGSIIEGDSGTQLMSFPISLNQTATGPVVFNVETKDGSGKIVIDYQGLDMPFTIPAGNLLDTLFVPVQGDTTHEPTETFSVKLSGIPDSDVMFGSRKVTGTITDNDPVPTVIIAPLTSVNENQGTSFFQISLSNPTSERASVNLEFVSGSAESPGDFKGRRGKVKFDPDQVLDSLSPAIVNDNLPESTETFTVLLADARGAILNVTSTVGTIRIVDDD